jgi:ribose transport system permease protein
MALGFVIVFGLAVGLINGLLITKLNVNSFIATLGTGLIIKGVLNGMFSSGSLGSVPKGFQTLGYGGIGPIPYSIILLLVIVMLGWFILAWTKFGSHLYGVGGDLIIGRQSGLRTSRVLTIAHIISSLTAVIAGLFIVSRLGAGNPTVGPDGVYDLESVATTVIGGTALSGGRGGVFGTIAGVVIFGIIDTVFNQLGVDTYLKMVIRGAIIIFAVASYSVRSKREAA